MVCGEAVRSYSQNNEQDVILNFFGSHVGRFLDIGAFDGVELSNTRALAELGWSGIMVEPSPPCLVRLIESVKGFNSRVEVWACAVSGSAGMAKLSMSSDISRVWANSIEPTFPEDYIPGKINVPVYVPTVSIRTILSGNDFNFISIDAEWKDLEILRDTPQGIPGCELLCIEPSDSNCRSEMIRYLKDFHGFEVHYETHENILARRMM
jgi:FkbM family methyltransferase